MDFIYLDNEPTGDLRSQLGLSGQQTETLNKVLQPNVQKLPYSRSTACTHLKIGNATAFKIIRHRQLLK